MKVEKKETVEADIAETEFGTVHEWRNGLGLSIEQKNGLKFTLLDDRLYVRIPVIRHGHDHNSYCEMKIEGLNFETWEGAQYSVKDQCKMTKPKLTFCGMSYIPTFNNAKELRWFLMHDLAKEVGKQFGHAEDGLVIQGYPVDDCNKNCITVIGTKDALKRLYKLIKLREE